MWAVFDAYRSWVCSALVADYWRNTCLCLCSWTELKLIWIAVSTTENAADCHKSIDNTELQINFPPCFGRTGVIFIISSGQHRLDTADAEESGNLNFACMKYSYKNLLHVANIWTIKSLFTVAFWPWAKLGDWLEDGTVCSLPADWYLWDHTGTDGKISEPRWQSSSWKSPSSRHWEVSSISV